MTEPVPFSAAIRDRSHAAHSGSEGAGFMTDLMAERGSLDDYTALVVQHWFIYEALEEAAPTLRTDAVVAPFLSPELDRLPSIEADLDHLLGPAWRGTVSPLPATQRYVDRIREVGATWPGGLVAHHYTRYLGDLSGGQFIGRILARQFGFAEDGVRFYLFADIADPAPSRTPIASCWTVRPGKPTSRSASSRRSFSPTASTPSCSRTCSPTRRHASPDPLCAHSAAARTAAMKRRTSRSTRMSLGRSGRDRYRPSSDVSRDRAT